jgi:hypothetical protein
MKLSLIWNLRLNLTEVTRAFPSLPNGIDIGIPPASE